MDKYRMINEAVLALIDSEDDGTIDREFLTRWLRLAVETSWQDDMTLDGLIQAARRKFQYWVQGEH